MNVNNFFKFIGDKFPKYRMTSDNEEMRVMFHKQYEKDIMNHERDGEEVLSAYMGVPGESTVDANGKNGKFVQYGAEAEIFSDSDGEREINYRYTSYETDFKNDIKHGHEMVYDETYQNKKNLLSDIEYDNGKKIKRTRYKYFYLNRKSYGPFVENVTYYNDKGEEVAVDFYRFITQGNGTEVIKSEPNYRKFYKKEPVINKMTGKPVNVLLQLGSISIPHGAQDLSKSTIYFDPNGNEISYDEWNDLHNKNKEGYR
jgi:hypothetical protein